MKRILPVLISLSLLVTPVMALAQQPGPEDAPGWYEIDVMDVLENIANWLFAVLLVIAAIFIIVAGYFFVTAAGDPDKSKKARDFVMYALIGVLVGFIAKGLVILVETIVFD